MNLLLSLFFTLGFFYSAQAFAKVISLPELVKFAEENDHRVEASHDGVKSAEKGITAANSYYFPTLDFQAIDSSGFPGSTASSLGVYGLAGSPYRSGIAYDFLLRQTLYDFGRSSARTQIAGATLASQKLRKPEILAQIDIEATRAFFNCVEAKTAVDQWKFFSTQAKLVADEVSKFVLTGQRSKVEKYLSKTQLDEYLRKKKEAEDQLHYSLIFLNQIAVHEEQDLECPLLTEIYWPEKTSQSEDQTHPTTARLSAELEILKAQISAEKSDYYPKIVAVGTLGHMADNRLVQKRGYAVGVGLEVPIFSGGITKAKVARAEIDLNAAEESLRATQDNIKRTNIIYSQKIAIEKSKSELLALEMEDAQKGFLIAKTRYFSMQGNLIELREALKAYLNTKDEYARSKIHYYQYVIEEDLYNGDRQRIR